MTDDFPMNCAAQLDNMIINCGVNLFIRINLFTFSFSIDMFLAFFFKTSYSEVKKKRIVEKQKKLGMQQVKTLNELIWAETGTDYL